MDIQILSASVPADRTAWHTLWQSLPPERQDVYSLPEFLLANEADHRGVGRCFVAQSGEALLLYPFLLDALPDRIAAELNRPAFDIQTPYGYGGPIANQPGENRSFLDRAWHCFSDWCRSAGVIAEFCRFHPLIRNERWASSLMAVHANRPTVYIDLTTYPHQFHSHSYFRNHRKMVSKAVRYGCTTQSLPAQGQMTWFAAKYAHTQDLLGAAAETRFGLPYFSALTACNPARTTLHVLSRAHEIVSATLMVETGIYAHPHLMIYNEEQTSWGATNALYHFAALDAAQRGFQIMHFGGGRTASDQDSLFKFKTRLSPARALFSIGTRTHDPAQFERIKRCWEIQCGPIPAGFFLFYRSQPTPAPGAPSIQPISTLNSD